MLVYGHRTVRLNLQSFVAGFVSQIEALPARPSHDSVIELLVDFGEIEAAVDDALAPDRDDIHTASLPWQRTAAALAEAVCASASGDDVTAPMAALRDAVQALDCRGCPPWVEARTAEGFAHYALFPEQYIDAANLLRARVRSTSLTFVGLRSIGSILAHVTAAACRRAGVQSDVISIRPRGHPFDRTVAMGAALRSSISARSHATYFAIVDEGPGLSGSSLGGAADALMECGVPADRIALVPAWNASGTSFGSARTQAAWRRHDRIVGSFTPAWTAGLCDLSAGAWRARLYAARDQWPAVQPQHERRKYLAPDPTGAVLFRFAGLGRYGRGKYARAERLADAGFGPPPVALRDGYLGLAWMDGVPLGAHHDVDAAIIERLARYAAFVRRSFETTDRDDVEGLAEAMTCNAVEALGAGCGRAIAALGREAAAFSEPAIAVDGRHLPHEWIATERGIFKADALDHHADDFLPGCRDIAWDLAGAIVEFGLVAAAEYALIDRYVRASGDRRVDSRLPFYCAAYLAFRVGYTSLCADTLGATADGLGFRRLAEHYRRSLDERLRRPR